jgi:hypothetical protein
MKEMRAKSSDKVSKMESKEDLAKVNLSQLKSLIDRGIEVEKSRIDSLISKKYILKDLLTKGPDKFEDDSKSYLRVKISKIMLDISKGLGDVNRRRSVS